METFRNGNIAAQYSTILTEVRPSRGVSPKQLITAWAAGIHQTLKLWRTYVKPSAIIARNPAKLLSRDLYSALRIWERSQGMGIEIFIH